jgi:hypothetical protein
MPGYRMLLSSRSIDTSVPYGIQHIDNALDIDPARRPHQETGVRHADCGEVEDS